MKRFCQMMMLMGTAAALAGACSEKKGEEPFRYTVDANATLLSDNEIRTEIRKVTIH